MCQQKIKFVLTLITTDLTLVATVTLNAFGLDQKVNCRSMPKALRKCQMFDCHILYVLEQYTWYHNTE